MIENESASIVIIAQLFNPSILTEAWINKYDIIELPKLEGVRIFSPNVVQFQTSEVGVQVTPQKMQIVFNTHNPKEDILIHKDIAIKTVNLLPHTPFQSLGLNFDFFIIEPPGEIFNEYNKKLLGSGDSKLSQEFSSSDVKYGRYFSKNHGDARLKLNIVPVQRIDDKKDLIKFSFNFHHDITNYEVDKRCARLVELISRWKSLYDFSRNLVITAGTL